MLANYHSNPLIDRHVHLHEFLCALKIHPTHIALERCFSDALRGKAVLFALSGDGKLDGSTIGKAYSAGCGILGVALHGTEVLNIPRPAEHPRFDPRVDSGEQASLYIPLQTHQTVFGVVLVRRGASELPFSVVDEETAGWLSAKFRVLSHLVAPMRGAVMDSARPEYGSGDLHQRLQQDFGCEEVEFWMRERGMLSRATTGAFEKVEPSQAGAVGALIDSPISANVTDVSVCNGYLPAVDKWPNLLFVPHSTRRALFAVVLRGKVGRSAFSNLDQGQVEGMMPILSKSVLKLAISEQDALDSSSFSLRLKTLLDVAESLSGVLDIDSLIPTIMRRACQLMNAEACSLFLVDADRRELRTTFQSGLRDSIRIPMGSGIAGHAAMTGKIANLPDAYADPRFDREIDRLTGFRTRTLLAVPIFNNRGEVSGVTEMVNRMDGLPFNPDDERMMVAFNVFCGISLDNARLYRTSLELTRQLKGFAEMGSVMSQTTRIDRLLEQVLQNAKGLVSASRASLFVRRSDGELQLDYNIGEPVTRGSVFAQEVVSFSKMRSFPGDGIYGFPLLGSDSGILGVMELRCQWRLTPEDLKLLDCFGVFAALSLERAALEEITAKGGVEAQFHAWIGEDEAARTGVPVKLRVPNVAGVFLTLNFDAQMWAGVNLVKVPFAIYSHWNLLEEFHIPSGTLFRFISTLIDTYNKVPYHNAIHAVADVTQYVSYEVHLAGLDSKLTRLELLGLLVSTVCHDANHDGFTNAFNVKAETPRGILFKNQSVLETHHCEVSIGVLSKPECNIFASLSAEDYRMVWGTIIALILSTDMAKHFEILKTSNAKMDERSINWSSPEDRLMVLQLVIKAGDISNVSRPFALADKWCEVLCEEFWRQGDLEMAKGMEYTSPLNDREHLDKAKSQTGFYTFVCLPLYKTLARALPPLQACVDQVESNLSQWKAAVEERQAAGAGPGK